MKRNKFSLSSYKLLTCDMAEFVPISCKEILPGDAIQQATRLLVRVSPLNAPVMHPVQIRIQHWFVPTRLVWDDWEDFITGGEDGLDSSVHPYVNYATGVAQGSLGDYLGIPNSQASTDVSALPFRSYNLIYNEWMRNQDLQTKIPIQTTSGLDNVTERNLLNVNWERDYFTNSKPWTQKGDEVVLPLGESAPITGLGTQNQTFASGPQNAYETDGSGATVYDDYGNAFYTEEDPDNPGFPNIRANLAGATGATINELKEAFALQRFAEARAQYGSRYTEYLRYLGVRSADSRLDRPEFLAGGRQTIQFSEVLQSGVTTSGAEDGVGNLRGHGIGTVKSNRFRKQFTEHGLLITTMSVMPKTMYAQGVEKMWSRQTKEDYYQKELADIGEEEILNKEIYIKHSAPDDIFGYSSRYESYKSTESNIAGEFRSTLDHWHMARIFDADVTLNAAFIEANPTKRIHQVESEDVLWVMAKHSIQARRMVLK